MAAVSDSAGQTLEPALSPKAGQWPASARPILARVLNNWLAVATLLLVAGGLAALVWGYLASAAVVSVAVDGFSARVRSHQATVGDLLSEMQVAVQPEDWLTPSPATPLAAGLAIHLQRARPLVLQFDPVAPETAADRQALELRTHAATIGQALAEAGIALNSADELTLEGQPALAGTALPAVAFTDGRRMPGIRRVYPWHDLSMHPLRAVLRRAIPLVVEDNGVPSTVWTTASTVGEALARQGMSFYQADLVEPGLAAPVAANLYIKVERSIPVTVRVGSNALHTRTRAQTVADLLAEQGLVLAGLDRVEPALDAALNGQAVIQVTRVEHVYQIEEDVTPYLTLWQPDPDMEIDTSRLDQEGVDGITRHRYLAVLENGQPVTRTLQESWLAQEPITRTFKYGAKIVLRELETADGPMTYWRKIRMIATSYSPANSGVSPDAPYYGRTRLGLKVQRGIVAVDPAVISLRSQVYVPGYGRALAADTGSGVKGRWIDLAFTDDEFKSWHGCVDVYLLGPPPPSYLITYRLPNYPTAPCLRR